MSVKKILSTKLIPEIIKLIMTEENIDDISATYKFYLSKTYELLSKEKTKLWKLEAKQIYGIYRNEVTTGVVAFGG